MNCFPLYMSRTQMQISHNSETEEGGEHLRVKAVWRKQGLQDTTKQELACWRHWDGQLEPTALRWCSKPYSFFSHVTVKVQALLKPDFWRPPGEEKMLENQYYPLLKLSLNHKKKEEIPDLWTSQRTSRTWIHHTPRLLPTLPNPIPAYWMLIKQGKLPLKEDWEEPGSKKA